MVIISNSRKNKIWWHVKTTCRLNKNIQQKPCKMNSHKPHSISGITTEKFNGFAKPLTLNHRNKCPDQLILRHEPAQSTQDEVWLLYPSSTAEQQTIPTLSSLKQSFVAQDSGQTRVQLVFRHWSPGFNHAAALKYSRWLQASLYSRAVESFTLHLAPKMKEILNNYIHGIH